MNKKMITIFLIFVFSVLFFSEIFSEDKKNPIAYHGADSVFNQEGITVIWALLKGESLEDSIVYLKLNTSEEIRSRFRYYSVKASDPFSDRVEWLILGEELKENISIKLERILFEDLTARELLFYYTFNPENGLSQKHDLSIYYLSLPDTTPEFTSLEKLEKYFIDAEARLKDLETVK